MPKATYRKVSKRSKKNHAQLAASIRWQANQQQSTSRAIDLVGEYDEGYTPIVHDESHEYDEGYTPIVHDESHVIEDIEHTTSMNIDSEPTQVLHEEDLPPLIMERCPTTSASSVSLPVSGRRVVDMPYFIDQLVQFSKHGLLSCGINHLIMEKEKQYGLKSGITFKCSMCHFTKTLFTDKNEDGQMNVNVAITSGTLAAGVGFSTAEEIFSAANIPFMTNRTYTKCEAILRPAIYETACVEMERAAAEESKLALEAGQVDYDGTPLITVVADGCWAKRSYKSKYDSLSGLAVIMGYNTKKVLFIGIKNRYCVMCARAEKKGLSPTEHVCFKNWTGNATSMEAEIIYEGFRHSEELYGIRYNRLIADGDSSVYSTLLNRRPYRNTGIQKVECSNHLLRNFVKKLRLIVESKAYGTAALRRLLKEKVPGMRKAVNTASRHWSQKDGVLDDKIEGLRRDIKNAPMHAFGHHSNCAAYFCKGPKEGEIDMVGQLRIRGMWQKIEDVFFFLARHSSSLIQRVNNNLAENFNSVVAKFMGGKRINFCLRGNYQTRCFGAVVSANSKVLQTRLNKSLYGKSPGKYTKRWDTRHQERCAKKKKPKCWKKLFPQCKADKDYGATAEKPDLEPAQMATECEEFMLALSLTADQRSGLEKITRDQSNTSEWHEERRKRLTASNFGQICKRRQSTKPSKLVDRLLYGAKFTSKATEYGLLSEDKAITLLEKDINIKIKKSGFVIDEDHPFLGASPDGLLGEDGLIEIKSPYSKRHLPPDEAIKQLPYFDKEGKLKKNSNYYYQIQGQLGVTKRNYCLLVVYTDCEPCIHVEKIDKNIKQWESMVEKLRKFYFQFVLPELVDPRRERSMPLRESAQDDLEISVNLLPSK